MNTLKFFTYVPNDTDIVAINGKSPILNKSFSNKPFYTCVQDILDDRNFNPNESYIVEIEFCDPTEVIHALYLTMQHLANNGNRTPFTTRVTKTLVVKEHDYS
jgi:hypothetical protein